MQTTVVKGAVGTVTTVTKETTTNYPATSWTQESKVFTKNVISDKSPEIESCISPFPDGSIATMSDIDQSSGYFGSTMGMDSSNLTMHKTVSSSTSTMTKTVNDGITGTIMEVTSSESCLPKVRTRVKIWKRNTQRVGTAHFWRFHRTRTVQSSVIKVLFANKLSLRDNSAFH